MAGISSISYRKLCESFGAALTFTEMVSAKAITMKDKKTFSILTTKLAFDGLEYDKDAKTGIQLFGHDEKIISEAIKILDEKYGNEYFLYDINMGCPVPKIVKNLEGSALLKDLKLAEKIIRNSVKATIKPISVKMRLGFDKENINLEETIKRFEAAGASLISIHGRTRDQFYKGKSDNEMVAKIKNKVNPKIPIAISGDIFSAETALRMIKDFNFNYIIIARGSIGRPWIFEDCIRKKNGKRLEDKNLDYIKKIFLLHLDMLISEKGESVSVKEIRKFIGYYFKGQRGVKELKNSINKSREVKEIKEKINLL
ncbi:MAG: tRNA-dihydrouridine synthase [Clostridiales Family XIII bacterium]|jgi:tRNA-dihydrouridine synthase B|nr:tRNA-dihydrouridine synthase [Clostridiales Family XIII bacterium]